MESVKTILAKKKWLQIMSVFLTFIEFNILYNSICLLTTLVFSILEGNSISTKSFDSIYLLHYTMIHGML